ncbi:MAG: endonuclease/exonuclease/phosphatase family protein [Bacteroidales bacterium]|nr:endonuclease/exonuclease/phosphatase family protein [Bacteroidales bacterium]
MGFNYSFAFPQEEKTFKIACIGFYNLENLFDTVLDADLYNNVEFTPEGPNQWTSARYHEKLNHMAFVISQIATDITPDGPALLGVSEIENRRVLEDLVKEESIRDRNYQIVHYDSPDARGVDVGLLYQPKYFKVTNSKSYKLNMDDSRFKTRDQLVVSGLLDGEMIHVIVNHWPSRRGGEKNSRPKRNAAGDLSRYIVDSLLNADANAKIMVMGDLNDDPVNPSVLDHLGGKGSENKLQEKDMYNPMFKLYRDGIGSLAYRDAWNLFDQIVISQGLLGKDYNSYKFYSAKVFNKNFLKQKEGAYMGYPLRTFAGGVYLGGYSDHFPVYILLIKEIK